MPGVPNEMGAEGQQQPQLPPEVQQNDEIVKGAVKDYLQETGEVEGSAEEGGEAANDENPTEQPEEE